MKDILQKLAAIEASAPAALTESVAEASNFDSKKISTGTVYSRKYDPETGETTGNKRTAEPEVKRGRGRPAKGAGETGEVMKPDWSAFGVGKAGKLPAYKGKVTKHKMVGETAMLERAMDVIEQAVMLEKEMSDAQKSKREEIVKGMKQNMAGFEKRYGDRAEAVMYATATKQAMKEGANTYMPTGDEVAGTNPAKDGAMGKVKRFAKKVMNKVAPDDETLLKDLYNKTQGVSEGKVDEDEVEEGNAFTGAKAKAEAEGKDEFEVDGKKYKVNESAELTECGMDMAAPAAEVTISGSPDAINAMLKLAGMQQLAVQPPMAAMAPEAVPEAEVEEEYANEPDEEYMGIDAVIPSGDDLHKEKGAYPAAAGGDNPMAIDEEMWAAYQALKQELQ